jgi:excisionase family DNA binding protein
VAANARNISPPADSAQSRIPRLAVSKVEAAEALGVSVDFLEEHVMHELRIVRRGRRRLIPIAELSRWMEANAHRTLGGE